MLKSVASAVSLSSLISTSAMALNVEIPMLVRETEEIATLSNLDPRPADLSIQGAELAIADNTTTGKFLGHQYSLKIHNLSVDGDLADVALSILADHQIIITDLPSEDLLQIADLPEAANALIINATAEDSALRDGACRANVLHTAPSLAMRTDALMQYFLFKRWGKLAMIEGQTSR